MTRTLRWGGKGQGWHPKSGFDILTRNTHSLAPEGGRMAVKKRMPGLVVWSTPWKPMSRPSPLPRDACLPLDGDKPELNGREAHDEFSLCRIERSAKTSLCGKPEIIGRQPPMSHQKQLMSWQKTEHKTSSREAKALLNNIFIYSHNNSHQTNDTMMPHY